MSAYWSWPFFSTVRFDNSLTQARDLLAAERNFLASIRSAFLVILASTAAIFEMNTGSERSWAEWTLVGLTWLLSIALPVVALHNYASTFDGYFSENASVRNSTWLLFVFAALAMCAILFIVREYVQTSS